MPRRAISSMSPTEFKFLRDLMGFTQSDVADYVGVSSPRVVADWDATRNPSQPAAQWITEQKELFASNLQKTLNTALPTTIDENGNSVVQLRRYTTEEQLHEAHPGYDRVRHYDAHLRAVAAVLTSRGVNYSIIS